MTDRGTDDAVVRSRRRRGNDAFGRLLEDVFDSFIEHGVFAFPALLFSVMAVPRNVSTALVGGYVAFLAGLAVVRDDRVHVRDRRFPPWPRGLTTRPVVRFCYYNGVVLVVALLAIASALVGGEVGSALTAATIAFGGVAGVAFPVVFAAIPRWGPAALPRRRRDVYALRADRKRRDR